MIRDAKRRNAMTNTGALPKEPNAERQTPNAERE